MASGEQKRKPKPQTEEQAQTEETKSEATDTSEVDDLLDEIDSVLEVNEEEFVKGFIQKGGQAVIPVLLGGEFLSHVLGTLS